VIKQTENTDDDMENRILKAAEELFMEQGFAKTTMGAIARKADCNQALVHYYYRTKEKLFEQVFEEKIRFIAGNILAIDAGEGSFEEKIARMVGTHFDFLAANPLFVPFMAGELLSNPERFAPVLDRHGHYPRGLFSRLDEELTRQVAAGTVRPVAALDLMATIMSLNVAPFLVLPALRRLTTLPDGAVEEWLARRRQENIDTVISRIKL
jgi:AcrR family transcriptional regulator